MAAGGRGEGLATLAVLGWSALLWRQRWGCRPETLAALLLACELWVLEQRRTRPAPAPLLRDSAWLLVPLQIVWINVHVSYYLGLVVAAAFLLDGCWKAARGASAAAPRYLALILVCATAACLINPFGVRAVWQPFDFFLHGRYERIFQVVDELQPIDWSDNLRNGLPLYLLGFLALAAWRWRRIGFDAAQAVIMAVLLPQALSTNRFLGFLAVAIVPSFARDAESAAAQPGIRRIARSPWARVTVFMLPIVTLSYLEFTRLAPPFSLGVRWDRVPVRACDFMLDHDVHGRGYNMFWQGGYLLWRFWPEHGRLPFIDIHQTGTRTDRDLQVLSQRDSSAWRALDDRYRFDWVLLPTHQGPTQHLLDQLDAEKARWALVFTDDVACLFVRKDGTGAGIAAQTGYRDLRLGAVHFRELGERALRDTTLRSPLESQLDRAVASSPWNSRALALRASLGLMERRWDDARRDLEAALAVAPDLNAGHDWLAYALVMEGEPARALTEIERARRWGMSPVQADDLTRRARAMLASAPRH